VSARKSANETTGPLVVGARIAASDKVLRSFSIFGITRATSVEDEFVRFCIICDVSVVNEPLIVR